MKDRRKRDVVSWSRFFWCTIFVVFSFVLFTGFSFSTFRLRLFGDQFHPEIVTAWGRPALRAISGDYPMNSATVSIREAVMLPDQVLIFLKYPKSARLFTKEEFVCVYFSAGSSSSLSQRQFKLPPNQIDGYDVDDQMIRCPLNPRGFTVALALKSGGYIKPEPTKRWDSLVYEAMIDRDNTTIVFVKGLNLRSDRLYNTSKFDCLYGWDFRWPKFFLRSKVISIAQEIVRCQTPISILSNPWKVNNSIKVSIRVKGKETLQSIARLGLQPNQVPDPRANKPYEMCICTMLRNQVKFLKEWVMYHAQIGVQRWFIYDNNSEDNIDSVIESLVDSNFNISKHVWPWIKTQEAGFAHCALRARTSCKWVGFIDVDEFFHLPTGLNLLDVLRNQSESNDSNIAELRISCHCFGPSGLEHMPVEGVIVGYTCRIMAPERHKSIVKPDALNSTLINVVHHFHLRDEFGYVNTDRAILVINHYKYQVWEVFKEKFHMRVATYVVDWQNDKNVGSKDRVPGLGTRAVEPPDWSSRFCEVNDTGLRDRVLENFRNPVTKLLPWQEDRGNLDVLP
ncbi:glycosyltransferase family 92 protein RCOM_0530710 isoform X2 [Manihot esculenta]|uniref:glycosyltransferase family 92 protein RCOM_0530710 isoform X2 n=1 Tax=Manihot esculenta TaxID=3983 RepID=UPI001CC59946|nr:glycosyltransferase family 92 protein RCOM_0530710 isoform X2 [Manihot esculenta]